MGEQEMMAMHLHQAHQAHSGAGAAAVPVSLPPISSLLAPVGGGSRGQGDNPQQHAHRTLLVQGSTLPLMIPHNAAVYHAYTAIPAAPGDVTRSSSQTSLTSDSALSSLSSLASVSVSALQQHRVPLEQTVAPQHQHQHPVEVPTSSSVDKKPRRYRCKTCEKCFTTSGHLARHSRIHTGERKHHCPHPGCEARFARQDNCMQHYRTHSTAKSRRRRIRERV